MSDTNNANLTDASAKGSEKISQKIIAANFKCNLTRTQTLEYAKGLSNALNQNLATNELPKVLIFPATSSLIDNNFSEFQIGAQNAHTAQNGAFTGEIGLEQLNEFGIKCVLVGHSERRTIFGETQEIVARKFEFFKSQNFKIIYCIGESLQTRQSGEKAVAQFLKSQFVGIDLDFENLVVAYEPIWAIGTGISADSEQICATHKILRDMTDKPLLYGGSVNEKNCDEILSMPNVNGVLVGSASLKLESFLKIIKSAC